MTPDWEDIGFTKREKTLVKEILSANKKDDVCREFQNAFAANKEGLHDVDLNSCKIVDIALFKTYLLWVPDSLHSELLQKT